MQTDVVDARVYQIMLGRAGPVLRKHVVREYAERYLPHEWRLGPTGKRTIPAWQQNIVGNALARLRWKWHCADQLTHDGWVQRGWWVLKPNGHHDWLSREEEQ